MLKIAIVGAGISGLSCAYHLAKNHQIRVFESADEVGGHTATKNVEVEGQSYDVDTGFIVYNDWTYPNFMALMDEIGIKGRKSEMSFSVTCETTGLEYAGSNINTLFADRKNLLRPAYWKMLRDIVRFNKVAISDLTANRISPDITLADYLREKNFGQMFRDKYLVPMGAAIWSSTLRGIDEFPALFFIRFFRNHGLLSVKNRPQWYTIVGGSRRYLPALTQSFEDSIRTGVTITKISRTESHVDIEFNDSDGLTVSERYDMLVLATHSDQALALLSDATSVEKEILGAIPYRPNEVVLHTDSSRLPWRQTAWSSWNYRLPKSHSNASGDEAGNGQEPLPMLTYDMNILQGIKSNTRFCVSLNQTEEIDNNKILGVYNYSHPVFTSEGVAAQARWTEIAGANKTWFCGAYWANGFHEDGVKSALRVVESINKVSSIEAQSEAQSVDQPPGLNAAGGISASV